MTPQESPAVQEAHDQLLADLLGQLTEEQQRGREPDLEGRMRLHPEVADELRALWAVTQLAGAFVDAKATHSYVGNKEPEHRPSPKQLTFPRPFGRYVLLEELGRGGMGVVYKARQQHPERLVAIKMILRGELASTAELQRFQAEAQSAARLDGIANIVSVHEVDEVDGQPYFSMEFVPGTTLAKRLQQGPLAPREAALCMATICEAVHKAHEQGILHRDLKPSNVMIDEDGKPHVTDFGLAKRVQDGIPISQTGTIAGTPSYMSPEQAAGSRGTLGPASDVYSLGAILYEILTGQPPFQASSQMDTLMLVLERDVVPPRLLNRRVDPLLEMICLKCLQKPADLRYSSAAALAADLRAYLEGGDMSARPSGIGTLFGQLFRDTHHAAVLENWGLLWITHSFKLLALVLVTITMHHFGFLGHFPYLVLWSIALVFWGQVFWWLRRRGGPVTFIERQIAHVWAAGILGSISIFAAEWVHGLPVLSMAPGLAVVAAMVFLVKAGMLSGRLYAYAGLYVLTSMAMALMPAEPELQLLLFGLVAWASFFFPGLKYYRLRNRQVLMAE
jgi:tRNA A-37 threonylcarbamoyl transferase component Bud32